MYEAYVLRDDSYVMYVPHIVGVRKPHSYVSNIYIGDKKY